MALTTAERNDLKLAKELLENPGLAAKLSNYIGAPIPMALKRLPDSWNTAVNDVARKSIEKALDIALLTIDKNGKSTSSNWLHKLAVIATGAGGGAFGLPALAIELPLSTTIMLRSIADIARSEGEDVHSPDGRLQCVQILALGGSSESDDGAESGYFAARVALSKSITEAAVHLTEKGMSQQGAPAIVRLISQIASRFSIVVSEKAMAQSMPVVGAFGGAAINSLFMSHFQAMGQGHFIVRRLERLYGGEEIHRLYHEI